MDILSAIYGFNVGLVTAIVIILALAWLTKEG